MKTRNEKEAVVASLDRPCIALVDDDADFRGLVRGWLRARYDTISFSSAEEWLDGEEEEDALIPDLLITDVVMPGINGFKLCESVRAHPGRGDLPILFLTGMDSDDCFVRGQEAGASAYLTKPVERAVLLAKIEELLEVSRKC